MYESSVIRGIKLLVYVRCKGTWACVRHEGRLVYVRYGGGQVSAYEDACIRERYKIGWVHVRYKGAWV